MLYLSITLEASNTGSNTGTNEKLGKRVAVVIIIIIIMKVCNDLYKKKGRIEQ